MLTVLKQTTIREKTMSGSRSSRTSIDGRNIPIGTGSLGVQGHRPQIGRRTSIHAWNRDIVHLLNGRNSRRGGSTISSLALKKEGIREELAKFMKKVEVVAHLSPASRRSRLRHSNVLIHSRVVGGRRSTSRRRILGIGYLDNWAETSSRSELKIETDERKSRTHHEQAPDGFVARFSTRWPETAQLSPARSRSLAYNENTRSCEQRQQQKPSEHRKRKQRLPAGLLWSSYPSPSSRKKLEEQKKFQKEKRGTSKGRIIDLIEEFMRRRVPWLTA